MSDERVYEADTETIKNAAMLVRSNTEAAREQYFKIVSEMEAIEASWSGTAHKSYMEKLRGDVAELRRIIEDIGLFADDLDEICKAYDKGEEEITGMLSLLSF